MSDRLGCGEAARWQNPVCTAGCLAGDEEVKDRQFAVRCKLICNVKKYMGIWKWKQLR